MKVLQVSETYTKLIGVIVSMIMVICYLFVSYKNKAYESEKSTPFECGLDPLSSMRAPFSLRFFVLVVLFLVFDVEIALIFPAVNMSMLSNMLAISLMLFLFLVILVLGLLHEWTQGALDWSE